MNPLLPTCTASISRAQFSENGGRGTKWEDRQLAQTRRAFQMTTLYTHRCQHLWMGSTACCLLKGSGSQTGIPSQQVPSYCRQPQTLLSPALPASTVSARAHTHTHTQHQNLREWLVFAASWVKSPAPHMGTGSRPDCSMT